MYKLKPNLSYFPKPLDFYTPLTILVKYAFNLGNALTVDLLLIELLEMEFIGGRRANMTQLQAINEAGDVYIVPSDLFDLNIQVETDETN